MPKGKATETADHGQSPEIMFEGMYHLVITGFDSEPRNPKTQEVLDGWKVVWTPVDGTARTEDGSKCKQPQTNVEQMFWNQDASKDSRLNEEKQTRLLLATGAIKEEDLGKPFDFPDSNMVGRQLVAKFSANTYRGKTEIQLHFKAMWHVDDPEVDGIPKSKTHLDALPASHRRTTQAAVQQSQEQVKKPTPTVL
jgi:hypothetical protein